MPSRRVSPAFWKKPCPATDDVVGVCGPKQADAPVQATVAVAEIEPAAQPRLIGPRNHLFQLGVGNEKIIDQARPGRIGAAELERGRRAVRVRIARIARHVRREFIGRADHGIEA